MRSSDCTIDIFWINEWMDHQNEANLICIEFSSWFSCILNIDVWLEKRSISLKIIWLTSILALSHTYTHTHKTASQPIIKYQQCIVAPHRTLSRFHLNFNDLHAPFAENEYHGDCTEKLHTVLSKRGVEIDRIFPGFFHLNRGRF